MKNPFPALLVAGSLAVGSAGASAAGDISGSQDLTLSPDLAELLRAEMREIARGVQGVALSLAAADWTAIRDTSAQIRASYIMEKKLTKAQAVELEKTLPEPFKRLDAEFHQRAARLGAAAAAHDAELAVFHYSRLIESCAQCHAAYAARRFPGFGPGTPADSAHATHATP